MGAIAGRVWTISLVYRVVYRCQAEIFPKFSMAYPGIGLCTRVNLGDAKETTWSHTIREREQGPSPAPHPVFYNCKLLVLLHM